MIYLVNDRDEYIAADVWSSIRYSVYCQREECQRIVSTLSHRKRTNSPLIYLPTTIIHDSFIRFISFYSLSGANMYLKTHHQPQLRLHWYSIALIQTAQPLRSDCRLRQFIVNDIKDVSNGYLQFIYVYVCVH